MVQLSKLQTVFGKKVTNYKLNQSIIRLHERQIINAIKNNDTTEYKIGDFVRVKMGTLYSKVRKLIKSGDKKNIVVNYSPTVYKITHMLGKDKADRMVGNNAPVFSSHCPCSIHNQKCNNL
jgi:hypothetical protein